MTKPLHRDDSTRRDERAARSRGSALAATVVVILILLSAAGFALWRYVLLPGPEDVVRSLIKAGRAGGETAFIDCLSGRTLDMMNEKLGGTEGCVKGWKLGAGAAEFVEGKHYLIELANDDGAAATVIVKLGPVRVKRFEYAETIDLVKDGWRWKVDLTGAIAKANRASGRQAVPPSAASSR